MTTPPVSLFVNVGQVPWIERRPGVFWKVLWEDPDGHHKAILMRYEPGATSKYWKETGFTARYNTIPRASNFSTALVWLTRRSKARKYS